MLNDLAVAALQSQNRKSDRGFGFLFFKPGIARIAGLTPVSVFVKPLHKLAVDTANGIGKVTVDLVGACKIPFAPDHIKKFEARSAIGKKRKSPKC